MSLIQYNPWPLFDALRRDLDRDLREEATKAGREFQWQPRADIIEFADRYEIQMDLPGVDAEKVDIRVNDGTLTVQGQREIKNDADVEPERVRRERIAGRFERQFSLPRTVAVSDVSASSDSGVLHIVLPKSASAQPIKVKVAA